MPYSFVATVWAASPWWYALRHDASDSHLRSMNATADVSAAYFIDSSRTSSTSAETSASEGSAVSEAPLSIEPVRPADAAAMEWHAAMMHIPAASKPQAVRRVC